MWNADSHNDTQVLRFGRISRAITEFGRHIKHSRAVLLRRAISGRDILLCCLLVAFLSMASLAQSVPDSPSLARSRFLDKPNIALLSSLTAFQVLDAYRTDQTLDEGGRETWPVARHFCQSREGRIGYFWASYAMTIGSSYLLHRTGHHKLARMALIAGNVSAASGFAYTLAHTR